MKKLFLQDNALTSKFLLELFHIRSDYQAAKDLHAEREEAVSQLKEEHAEGNKMGELEKEMAQLKKERAGLKRKMDEHKRSRYQEVRAFLLTFHITERSLCLDLCMCVSVIHGGLIDRCVVAEPEAVASQGGPNQKESGTRQDNRRAQACHSVS